MSRIGIKRNHTCPSMSNLTKLIGTLGQQCIRGERPHRGFRDRTLSHFKKGDLDAESHDLVTSSLKGGLDPIEYFFHSMGEREGLVDKAVKFSRTGYMQRRLVNALENLMVYEDGTVREPSGTVIQFKYGEDGIDPMKSKKGKAVDMDDVFRELNS